MTDRHARQLQFTGTGSEYFRIWIVNTLLSIVTLGIYSAWAKVRRNQYFYRNTLLDNAGFDYHGDPKVILKGRILAVLLFAAYSGVGQFNPKAGLLVLALIMLVMPWLLMRSLRFRLHNSSYRNLRFAFHGETKPAYVNFLLWPFLSSITLGLLWPMAQQKINRYIRNNSAFGNVFFRFSADAGDFYKIYLLLFFIGVLVVAGLFGLGKFLNPNNMQARSAIGIFFTIGLLISILLAHAYIVARMQNLLWNHTQLGQHSFFANLKARELLGVMLGNLVLIVLTLGLYKPFADIRMARYRLEHIRLLPDGDIEQFVVGVQSRASAVGQEVADIFDMDIAL
jgi:uncharacterized membrane protein YjgN (DUF898 family)